MIESIVRDHDVEVQVRGRDRTAEAVDAWLQAGPTAVVMGTAAVRDPRLLERAPDGTRAAS